MKTRTFRTIDGMVGIAVFLLLSVAVIAGQSPQGLPRTMADDGQAQLLRAALSLRLDDEEFSLLVEALRTIPGGGDVIPGRWREDVRADRHPGIPE